MARFSCHFWSACLMNAFSSTLGSMGWPCTYDMCSMSATFNFFAGALAWGPGEEVTAPVPPRFLELPWAGTILAKKVRNALIGCSLQEMGIAPIIQPLSPIAMNSSSHTRWFVSRRLRHPLKDELPVFILKDHARVHIHEVPIREPEVDRPAKMMTVHCDANGFPSTTRSVQYDFRGPLLTDRAYTRNNCRLASSL